MQIFVSQSIIKSKRDTSNEVDLIGEHTDHE